MLVKLGANIPPLVTPPIPARSTPHLLRKAFLHTDTVIVVFVLLTRVIGKVELKMLDNRDPVVGVHSIIGDNLDDGMRYAPLVFIDDEESLQEGFVKNWNLKEEEKAIPPSPRYYEV